MGAEQERLERDIMRQRVQLGDDVDALVEKVSPSQAARRQVGRVTNAATTVKDRVMGRAEDVASSARDTFSSGPGGAHAAGSSLAEHASNAKDSVAEHASNAKDSVAEHASNAKDSVTNAKDSATDAARRRTEGNPLAAGLIAFGVGWLASSLIPASPVEERAGAALREQAGEPVKAAGQQLGEKAKEMAGNLREPAQQAVGSVKDTAADAVDEVKDRASTHAENLTGEAKDRTSTVKDAAQS